MLGAYCGGTRRSIWGGCGSNLPDAEMMYEENVAPLPEGDFAQVFADELKAIQEKCSSVADEKFSPEHVVRWSQRDLQPHLTRIARRLLLPGSGVKGLDNLAELTELARQGRSCLLCLNHRSNLDVPSLLALLKDTDQQEHFHRLVWLAGRKLEEDPGDTPSLVRAFNRVIVTPRSWLVEHRTAVDLRAAYRINAAAHRAMHDLKHQGWVFALFPAATRQRPRDGSTRKAIPETDGYLKKFEFLLLGRIDGCTLPVTLDHELTHETPVLDCLTVSFGNVQRTDQWRASAWRRFAGASQRSATALAIMEDIAALGRFSSA